MSFTQNFHGPVHNVYNVDGTLILSAESRAPDLVRELVRLRAELDAVPGVDASAREQVERQLAAAETEGRAPRPSGAAIKAHLDSAAGTLESATGVAERAVKLARTLVDMSKWAVALLA